MILPHSRGDKVVVRFRERDFEYWRGDSWTSKKWQANRYCWSEAMGVKQRLNKAKLGFTAAIVDY